MTDSSDTIPSSIREDLAGPWQIVGPFGRAESVRLDPAMRRAPEQEANLAIYLLTLPEAHPAWSQFILTVCHLRDVPGQTKPAVKHFPTATHELLLMALNPEPLAGELGSSGDKVPRWTTANLYDRMDAFRAEQKGWFLSPMNVIEHFEVATDHEAVLVVEMLVGSLVAGFLAPEPDGIIGARDEWRRQVAMAAQHALESHLTLERTLQEAMGVRRAGEGEGPVSVEETARGFAAWTRGFAPKRRRRPPPS